MLKGEIFNKIGFWIILFSAIRMFGITNPPLEIGHNWRQSTGLMLSRNFLEVDNNILYPRKDDHKGLSGIVGIEFPLLNYGHYLVSELFGYTHWYGRLLNLIVSSLGIWFFYKLFSQELGRQVAFYATIALLSSIWFAFSRKMMPDTFCISLVIIGLYFGFEYLRNKKWWHLIGFVIFATLGILSKIPAGVYLSMLAYPLFNSPIFTKHKIVFLLSGIFCVALVYWWYFIWNVHLSREFGVWYNSGQTIKDGFTSLMNYIPAALEKFYFSAFQGFIFFILCVGGIVLALIKKNYKLLIMALLVTIVFGLYVLKSGKYFHHHNYYIIPIVPIMSLFVGYVLTFIKQKRAIILIVAFGVVESLANQNHDFFAKDSEMYKLKLEPLMDQYVSSNEWIAINATDENHQLMYLAHRKGWMIYDADVLKNEVHQDLLKRGCTYLIVNKHTQPLLPNLVSLKETEDFAIFKLK